MAASKANTAYGATFSMGSVSSPLGYSTVLSEIKSIENNGVTLPSVDVSHLLSPNATDEMVPGTLKPGTIRLTGNFIGDTGQLTILSLIQARTTVAWKITAPVQQGAKTYTVNGLGFLSSYKNGPYENNRAIDFEIEFQTTGPLTEAVA